MTARCATLSSKVGMPSILCEPRRRPCKDSLPAGGRRLYREGVEPSGSLRKVSGYIALLLSRISPDARVVYDKRPSCGSQSRLPKGANSNDRKRGQHEHHTLATPTAALSGS